MTSLDLETKLRLRAQNAFAVAQSREAVETLWSFYGANAIYTRDPLQRYLRDVQAASQHFSFNFDIAGSAFGTRRARGKVCESDYVAVVRPAALRRRGAMGAGLSQPHGARGRAVPAGRRARPRRPHARQPPAASASASRSWSRTAPAPAATSPPRRWRSRAPDGYTLLATSDGPLVINPERLREHAVQHAARLRADLDRRERRPGADGLPDACRLTSLEEVSALAKIAQADLRHLGLRQQPARRRRAAQGLRAASSSRTCRTRDSAQAVGDAMSCNVDLIFGAISTGIPHIRAGKLKPIAVTQPEAPCRPARHADLRRGRPPGGGDRGLHGPARARPARRARSSSKLYCRGAAILQGEGNRASA